MRVYRKGVAYDGIVWILKRHFAIDAEP